MKELIKRKKDSNDSEKRCMSLKKQMAFPSPGVRNVQSSLSIGKQPNAHIKSTSW